MMDDQTTVSLAATLVVALLSGFVGALLPLIVQPYLRHRGKLYDRTRKHVDSLVKLEIRLLDIDATLHDNKILFSLITEGYKQNQVSIQRLIPLELEDSFFHDSFSQELNNKIYQFRYDLRRIDNDVSNFNHNYDLVTKAVLLDELESKKVKEKLGSLLIDADKLEQGFEDLQKHCQRLLAYSKLRAKRDRVKLMRYRSWVLQRRLKKIADDEVEAEMKRYLGEVVNKPKKEA